MEEFQGISISKHRTIEPNEDYFDFIVHKFIPIQSER